MAKTESWKNLINSINVNTSSSVVWGKYKAIQGKPDYIIIYHILGPHNKIISDAVKILEILVFVFF